MKFSSSSSAIWKRRFTSALWTLHLALPSCSSGDEPSQSHPLDDDGRSAAFGISIDTDGNVEVGTPVHRELKIEIHGSTTTADASDADERSEWTSSDERLVDQAPGDSVGDDDSGCFVYEAARDRLRDPTGLPSIRAATTLEIATERYRTRQEAEAAFDRQLSDVQASLADVWQGNEEQISKLRATVTGAAMAHNADVLRTLDLAEDALRAAANYAKEFRTSPLTTSGARLQRAATDLANAWQTLPTKFSGDDLKQRSNILKGAGIALRIADALLADGDVASGEYFTNIALTLIDIGLSSIPIIGWAKDVQEAATGYSLIFGRPLTTTERTFAIIGAATGGIGSKAHVAQKVLKGWREFFQTSNAGQEALTALTRAAQIIGH